MAGHTHPGEEEIVLDVYGKIIKDDPRWRLVIAPRHIERAPEIQRIYQSVRVLEDVYALLILLDSCVLCIQWLPWYLSEKVYVLVEGIISLSRPFMVRPLSLAPRSRILGILLLVLRKGNAIVQVEDAHSF